MCFLRERSRWHGKLLLVVLQFFKNMRCLQIRVFYSRELVRKQFCLCCHFVDFCCCPQLICHNNFLMKYILLPLWGERAIVDLWGRAILWEVLFCLLWRERLVFKKVLRSQRHRLVVQKWGYVLYLVGCFQLWLVLAVSWFWLWLFWCFHWLSVQDGDVFCCCCGIFICQFSFVY